MSVPTATVAAFWEALYARDWPRVRTFFVDESVYWDVPTGPKAAARGPDSIEARLRLGLDGLAGYDHHSGVVTVGRCGARDVVTTEHAETWRWPGGEVVTLPFVSVQHVVGRAIVLWKDYWDLDTLMRAAPQAWRDRLAAADLSWAYDASALS